VADVVASFAPPEAPVRALGPALRAASSDAAASCCTELGLPGRLCVLVDGTDTLVWREGRIEGTTRLVTGAATAAEFLVMVPGGRVALVPRDAEGLALTPVGSVGLPELGLAALRFTRCAVTPLAREDAAKVFRRQEAARRRAGAEAAISLAGACVDAAGEVAVARDLLRHQVVRHRLADLVAQMRLLQALAAETRRCADADHAQEAWLATLAAAQVSNIIDASQQLFGGHGYMAGHWLSDAFLETRSLHLLLETGETQGAPAVRDPSEPADLDAFRAEVARFIATRIVPHLAAWEQARSVPRSLFEDFGTAGYLGLTVPCAMGGGGRDLRYSLALVEAMMDWRMGAVAISLMLPANTICPLLVRYASPTLREAFLPGIVAGRLIPSLAVTEPGGTSNMLRTLRTTATDAGEDWVLDGEKIYITNGPIADVVFVLARTRPQHGPLSMTMIAVPTSTPGFRVFAWQPKVGLHISPTGHLGFERCRVPKRFTIGTVHHGYAYFNDVLSEERLLIAGGSAALTASCLREAIARAGPDAHAALRPEVARIEACRALCREIAGARQAGVQSMQDCWLAKFAVCDAARAAVAACDRVLQGTAHRAWIDAVSCDTRVLTIFAGASEIMRDLYATRLADRLRVTSRAAEA
jgi:alkylation response protein AidB-like acyl-CoA dehydrogenase